MSDEIWKPIFEGEHEISSHGRVRRIKSANPHWVFFVGRLMRPFIQHGYPAIRHYFDGKAKNFRVHALVMDAFIGPRQKGMHVNHIDGVKTNNNITNLEYVTPSGNQRNAVERGKHAGESSASAKLTNAKVLEIRRCLAKGIAGAELARTNCVSETAIWRIKWGKTWKKIV